MINKSLESYLSLFAAKADSWFAKANFVTANYNFFREFLRVENLQKMEWADVQRMGDHLHAARLPIARKNAFGRANHEIERYRRTFLHLIDGRGTPEQRMRDVVEKEEFTLKFLGDSTWSEIFAYAFSESVMIRNSRSEEALRILALEERPVHGQKWIDTFFAFSASLGQIQSDYLRIVGKRTELPLNIELDQFFSFLYETHKASSVRYWWLNCNPKIWDPRERPIGSLQTYTTRNEEGNKRRIYDYFVEAKPGDLMVGYVSNPVKAVCMLFEVTKGIHNSSDEDEIIEFKKVKDYAPISWDDLGELPSLADCEPLKNNQGSLFRLSPEEFKAIDELQDDLRVIEGRTDGVDYWSIAPGERGTHWQEWQAKGVITIGWEEMGDLTRFKDAEEVRKEFIKIFEPEKSPMNRVKGIYEFGHILKPGDIVFVKQGKAKLLAMGRVLSEYEFDSGRTEHNHQRRVEWLKVGNWDLPEQLRFNVKTLTKLTRYGNFVRELTSIATGDVTQISNAVPEPSTYSLDSALSEVFFEASELKQMLEALNYKKNIILQGPPGVGKTFAAERIAYALIGRKDPSRTGFVQFHPSFSYEDFVQGIRPSEDGRFQTKNGLFLEFCTQAKLAPEPFVVIIDEINRGNLSNIFGELMLLIEADKRDKNISLAYSQGGGGFSIPKNLYIIGTMNTADRSLSLVDYALRRRFSFFSLKPEFQSPKFVAHLHALGLSEIEVIKLQQRMLNLNSEIAADKRFLGPGFEIGHSYFGIRPEGKTFEEWFEAILRFEVEPLLREYWCDESERVSAVMAALRAA